MNHSQISQLDTNCITRFILATAMALLLVSCGGGNGDVGTDPSSSAPTTSIKGKVTISSTVTTPKPGLMATVLSKTGLPQTGQNQPSTLFKSLAATTLAAPDNLNGATIELYNADKSEWLHPVAATTSDSNGNYLLNKLINADKNLKEDGVTAAYTNGNPVPSGNYTVIASKFDANSRTTLIAVQAVVKKFSGAILDNDLRAQDSDAIPTVVAMLGLAKNSDGSFGSSTTPVAVNANIQVFFSMAMDRLSVKEGISIKNSSGSAVAGKWKVSPDLTAATFYPDSDFVPNEEGEAYVVNVTQDVKNVYGYPLASDVQGTFKTAPIDTTPPTAERNSPGRTQKNNMSIMTPIRIGVDEELDITSIQVAARPSLGDKPAIKFVGKSAAEKDAAYPYIYEIEPSTPLQLDTTYSLTVSGGLDMVGLSMDVLNFSFTTESTSAGIPDPADASAAEIAAKSAVKVVLGKWISALNARNTALLTSYMSGGFYWVNKTEQGFSRNDLNRDGRLSLNEFTGRMNTWFKDLDRCGSTVSGEVVTSDTTVPDGITLNGAMSNIAFTITATPTNTSDATCDTGPDSTLYAVMENINQAWLMTSGSDLPLAVLAPLTSITLLDPLDGFEFPDPTQLEGPLAPEFKWEAAKDIVNPDGTVSKVITYMVVLIDAHSGQRTGWAALVDGSAATAGTPLSAKFIGKPGDYGNMVVVDTAASNPLGFDNMISALQPGGEYYWAVIGFKTKTMAELKAFNVDLSTLLIASSESSDFSVAGVLRELTVEVKGATSGTVYPYSDTIRGYNVGSEASVIITVTSPNVIDITKPGAVNVSGYVQKNYPLNYSVGTTGLATASPTISLSNVSNWVRVDDGTGPPDPITGGNGPGLTAEFSIYTKGGALPKIGIASVTGKKCDTSAATLVGPNGWNNYSSADACTVTVSGTIDPAFAVGTTSLFINVHNNDGKGSYSTSIPTAAGVTSYTFPDIPVYTGQNWVSVSYVYYTAGALIEYHQNGFGIKTDEGETYTPPITVTVVGASNTLDDIKRSTWNAGSAGSVDVTVNMSKYSGTSTCSLASDPNNSSRGTCTLIGTTSTFVVTLYRGWNYINLFDGAGSNYTAAIYTTGGTVYDSPHLVTSINEVGQTPSTKYTYDAGSTCPAQVTINGRTTNAGSVNLSMGYSSNAGTTVYEVQTYTPLENVPPYTYTFTQNVYVGGSNTIEIRDGANNWQGVLVTTTCATAIPVVFAVTSVMAGGSVPPKDLYGTYQTTAGSVTVSGTAKTDRTITASVKGGGGSYAATITAGLSNTYSINLNLYTGVNDIYLDDGSNKFYLRVNTTAGDRTYTPPINSVAVSIAKLVSGGGVSDSYSSWNSSASSVTIGGKGQVDGAGYYYQTGTYYVSKGALTVSGGNFTLSNVSLGYGDNKFILYDFKGNSYELSIYTSGGIGAPAKLLQIASPLDGADIGTIGVTTPIKVYGAIDVSFVPVTVYAEVYDFKTLTYTYYSDQSLRPRGTNLLTYSFGKFSFDATVVGRNQTQIYVYAVDKSGIRQEHRIAVNKPVIR